MEQAILRSGRYTLQEYFDLEAGSEERFEFRNGEVLGMSGGSVNHSLIAANVAREIGNRTKGTSCRVHESGLRVRIARRTLYSHPDVTIVCGETELDPDDERGETVINPKLVVEVLSPSTELYDRTKKFARYREIESFQEYVLVSQTDAFVETFFRHPDGVWRMIPTLGIDKTIALDSLGVALPLTEIYAGVKFPPPEPELEID
jgi:Uma2 family endonuclease